jgi:hypothetical protein
MKKQQRRTLFASVRKRFGLLELTWMAQNAPGQKKDKEKGSDPGSLYRVCADFACLIAVVVP